MTIGALVRLVKAMRLNDKQIERLVSAVFKELKENKQITFKVKEEEAYRRAIELVHGDFARERELDDEVNRMMDDLERQNTEEFQRYKMFPLLKRRLAKEKGIVL